MIKLGFCWFTSDEESAGKISLQLPAELKNNSLALSLLLAGKMKKFVLEREPRECGLLRNLLDRSGYELWRSIEQSEGIRDNCSSPDCTPQIIEAFQLLSSEWILSTRVRLWEGTRVSDKETVTGFRRDLCTLRHLLSFIPSARTKLYLYEGCYRLMCNLNPLTSLILFERSLRKRRQNQSNVICTSDDVEPLSLSDTSDISSALIHMSCHLPDQLISCPAEKEGYLREAAQIMAQTSSSRKKVVL